MYFGSNFQVEEGVNTMSKVMKLMIYLFAWINCLDIFLATNSYAAEPTNKTVEKIIPQTIPGLFFDHQSDQYFINDKASFSIRAVENKDFIDRIEVSLNNAAYEVYNGNLKFDKEGFHIVRFKAIDPVLNWSPVESFRIYVDLTAPNTVYHWDGDTFAKEGKLYVGPETKLTIAAYDNLSGVKSIFVKDDNGDKTHRYTTPRTFPTAGEFNLKIGSSDNVGNAEVWRPLNFTVDNTAPTSKANVQGRSLQINDKMYLDKGSFIAIDAQDTGAGVKKVEYILNNGSISRYVEKLALESKVTNLKFRSVDHVGNTEEWKSVTVYLDAKAPTLADKLGGTYKKIAGKFYSKPGFTISVSLKDDESGENKLIYNNQNENENVTEKLFKFTNEGVQELIVRGEDKVGNVSNTEFYTVYVDNTAPETSLKTHKPLVEKEGLYLSSLPNMIELISVDNGVGVGSVEFSYDKKEIFKYEKAIDMATWKESRKTIFYRSIDELGNSENWKEMPILVKHRGPKVDLFVEASGFPAVPLSQIDLQNKKIISSQTPETSGPSTDADKNDKFKTTKTESPKSKKERARSISGKADKSKDNKKPSKKNKK
jgi:hypothetical protein